MFDVFIHGCSKCDFQQRLGRKVHRRRVQREVRELRFEVAWCEVEERIVGAEPTAQSLREGRDSLLIALRFTPMEEIVDTPTLQWFDSEILLLTHRQGGPRCLECGTEAIAHRTTDGDGVPRLLHPKCGGNLSITGLELEAGDAPVVEVDENGIRIQNP